MTYLIWSIPVGVFMVVVGPFIGAWWLTIVGAALIAYCIAGAIWLYRRGEY